jgi:hypothetical protein
VYSFLSIRSRVERLALASISRRQGDAALYQPSAIFQQGEGAALEVVAGLIEGNDLYWASASMSYSVLAQETRGSSSSGGLWRRACVSTVFPGIRLFHRGGATYPVSASDGRGCGKLSPGKGTGYNCERPMVAENNPPLAFQPSVSTQSFLRLFGNANAQASWVPPARKQDLSRQGLCQTGGLGDVLACCPYSPGDLVYRQRIGAV